MDRKGSQVIEGRRSFVLASVGIALGLGVAAASKFKLTELIFGNKVFDPTDLYKNEAVELYGPRRPTGPSISHDPFTDGIHHIIARDTNLKYVGDKETVKKDQNNRKTHKRNLSYIDYVLNPYDSQIREVFSRLELGKRDEELSMGIMIQESEMKKELPKDNPDSLTDRLDIDPKYVLCLIAQESRFKLESKSNRQAYGLMQTKIDPVIEINKFLFSTDPHFVGIRNRYQGEGNIERSIREVTTETINGLNIQNYTSSVISEIKTSTHELFSNLERRASRKVKKALQYHKGNFDQLLADLPSIVESEGRTLSDNIGSIYAHITEYFQSEKEGVNWRIERDLKRGISKIADQAINTPIFEELKTNTDLQLRYGMSYLSYLKKGIETDSFFGKKSDEYQERLLLARYNGGPSIKPKNDGPKFKPPRNVSADELLWSYNETTGYVNGILGRGDQKGRIQRFSETENEIDKVVHQSSNVHLEEFRQRTIETYRSLRFQIMTTFSPNIAGLAAEQFQENMAMYQKDHSKDGKKFVEYKNGSVSSLLDFIPTSRTDRELIALNDKPNFYTHTTNRRGTQLVLSHGDFLYVPVAQNKN